MQIQLPKLKKVNSQVRHKNKILLITDDIKYTSGVATISKEIVIGTVDRYDWVQLAAAMHHPDHGKIINLSEEIARETGVDDASVKQYCHTGYGNADVVREIITYERPDAILLVTDPRFFSHIFLMEHELRNQFKIPILYLQIWDNLPISYWNSSAYASCDLLMAINRQTEVINKVALEHHGTALTDINDYVSGQVPLDDFVPTGTNLISYVPHGSTSKYYYKQTEESPDWADFVKFRDDFKAKHNADFIVFYNSRNIRRKQPGDIILAFKYFIDSLPSDKAAKACLVMKTAIQDENGTDLLAVKKAICPDANIVFVQDLVSTQHLNWFYNLADCTFFMSSAEGFGLAANESLMCGTMIVAPVTGGLQDQMRFEDESGSWIQFNKDFTTNHAGKYTKCGEWAYPIFPAARALQGSIPTPYIFDDYCNAEDGADGLLYIHDLGIEERDRRGNTGRQWVLGTESGMSSIEMCKRFTRSADLAIKNFTPAPRMTIFKVEERKPITMSGIQRMQKSTRNLNK